MRRAGMIFAGGEGWFEEGSGGLSISALKRTNLTHEEEVRAYLSLPRRPQYVRRGMYALQLREWSKTFRVPGEILAVTLDPIRGADNRTSATASTREKEGERASRDAYRRVLQHVGLDPSHADAFSPGGGGRYRRYRNQTYAAPMTSRTRRLLELFYRPQNERLASLLGKEEWEGVWSY